MSSNPYAAPRIQRLVPERTAAGMYRLMVDSERHLRRISVKLQLETAACMARLVLQGFAAEDARLAGALPGEFDPQELRYAY
jgi:hypothetical protein